MTSAVWANQKRDRPVSTRPLSGIGVGRTTSKAAMRSLATSSRRSPTSNRSRTLPDRMNPAAWTAAPAALGSPGRSRAVGSAGGIGGLLLGRDKLIESGHGGGDVAQEVAFVEAGGKGLVGEPGRNVRIGGEHFAQLATFVGGSQGVALDHSVRLLPRHARFLDQRQQNAAAAVEPEPAFDV